MSSTGNRSALSNSSSSSVNKLLEKISKLEKAPARSTRSGYNNGLLPRDAYLKTNQISPTTNKYLNLLQKS
ncbi:hypothetical protein AX774_g5718 [Zancudomyces culisetae]|uniref:Uncharacterized protein n=1 Tax=Zancudomyces culisetae TaxID=1213189 RepID=A0A1R1PIM6_ZANCU|nr:hypothetical protein AX774_g5718 [Zancudomyces culisetae]|eukprot:OMH80834.1 hypothetical protein AX774_g5718 [Zancudomyces culisetae]